MDITDKSNDSQEQMVDIELIKLVIDNFLGKAPIIEIQLILS